jgi:hypothetical protein
MKKTTWPGNWKVACDVCDFWFPSGKMRERWDGLIVCPDDFETRHPQTLIKINGERAVPSFIRKDPDDDFIFICDVVSSSGYTGLGTVGCSQVGNDSVPYITLLEFYLNGHE